MLCALSQFLDRNANLANEKMTMAENGKETRHNRRHLPVVKGPHTVGSVDLMCDLSDHGTFFRLYYPTTPTDIHANYKQWPLWLPRKQYAHGFVLFLKRNKKIFGRLANWWGGDVYVPVLWHAPLLRENRKYPVVIVSHGIGGNRTYLSTYCCELASHGFVVAALEHRDGSASMTLCLQEQLNSPVRNSDPNDPCDLSSFNDLQDGSKRRSRKINNNNNDDQTSNNNKTNDDGNSNLITNTTTTTTTSANTVSFCNHGDSSNDKTKNTLSVKDGLTIKTSSSDSALHVKEPEADEVTDLKGVTFRVKEEARGRPRSAVRPRSLNKKRTLRHNHSCSEEWRPFQHIKVWDDFDHRNRQVYHRVEEISDILDELTSMNEGGHINNALGLAFNTTQFKGRLDLSRVAVIGHSFGGGAALATLTSDERFKVAVALDSWMHPLDPWVYNSTKQPALFLNMEQFQWEQNVNRMVKFQNANKESDRPMLTLQGGCHQSMTDFQFIVPQIVGRFLDVRHTLAPETCMASIVTASLAFLYKHLNMPMKQVHKDCLEGKHPHLMSGTNVDLTIPNTGPTPPGY